MLSRLCACFLSETIYCVSNDFRVPYDRLWGQNPASYLMGTGDSFRSIKRPKCDAIHSSSRPKNKNACCFIKYRMLPSLNFSRPVLGKTITLLQHGWRNGQIKSYLNCMHTTACNYGNRSSSLEWRGAARISILCCRVLQHNDLHGKIPVLGSRTHSQGRYSL
jgi:hypothetical protein